MRRKDHEITSRLIIKSGFRDENDFFDYARKNLLALLRGRLPVYEDKVLPIKGGYTFSREYECLEFYHFASKSTKMKKLPFFTYWFILQKQGLLNRRGIEDLSAGQVHIKKKWINEAITIIDRLSEDTELPEAVRNRLSIVHEGALRTYGRYQRKRIIEESLLNEPSPFFLISQAKRAAYEFISSRKTTTWRELRRHKRDVQKIRPIFLRWLLEDLEKEGRISIKDFPTGTYLVYKPSSVGKGRRGPL